MLLLYYSEITTDITKTDTDEQITMFVYLFMKTETI